jgi:glycosyltransferase involved in cell wall biosynthesis
MDLSDKNLLIITSWFPNNLSIYEWIFVREQLLFLKKYFKNIYVIRPQYYINAKFDILNILPSTWKEKAIREDYEIDNIKVFFPKVSALQPFKNWEIKKFIDNKNLKFNIIHSHFIYPSWEIGNYLKKKFNVKHICTAHGFDVYDLPFRNFLWNFKVKKILKNIDSVITVSEKNIECLEKLWLKNSEIQFLKNWYNNNKFSVLNKHISEFKKEVWLIWNKKILLNVGNLESVKDQEYLIDTFYELNKSWNDLFLIIIWEWSLRKQLEEKISNLNLNESIRLLWVIDNTKLVDYYNISDLFILTSKTESTWIVVLEAWACWLPSVIIKNWWTENYINNEVWIILDKKIKLASWIERWLTQNFNKIKIAKFFRDNYSLENLTKNLIGEYVELLK